MIDNDICFILDDKYLKIDKTLVEYDNIPIFYICYDQFFSKYIVLCVDIDSEEYFIAKSNNSRIVKLFRQEITMREMFTLEKECWVVTVGNSVEEDVHELQSINDIDKSVLPVEESYFHVVTQDLKEYIETIENDLYWDKNKWEGEITLSVSEKIHVKLESNITIEKVLFKSSFSLNCNTEFIYIDGKFINDSNFRPNRYIKPSYSECSYLRNINADVA